MQRRRWWGGQGGMCPPSFGVSVNPIRTKGGRSCPPYYYRPPQIFGRWGVSGMSFANPQWVVLHYKALSAEVGKFALVENVGGSSTDYRKIASSNTSHLEAHVGFFRLLVQGIFGPYLLLWPFDKKLIF